MFENEALKNIIRPKMGEVIRALIKLHIEEPLDIVRVTNEGGSGLCYGSTRGKYTP